MITTDGEEFKSVVKGNNFMTPKVLGYYISGDYICELSTDRNRELYGVTVVNGDKMEHEHGLSKSWPTKKQAIAYIAVLGK